MSLSCISNHALSVATVYFVFCLQRLFWAVECKMTLCCRCICVVAIATLSLLLLICCTFVALLLHMLLPFHDIWHMCCLCYTWCYTYVACIRPLSQVLQLCHMCCTSITYVRPPSHVLQLCHTCWTSVTHVARLSHMLHLCCLTCCTSAVTYVAPLLSHMLNLCPATVSSRVAHSALPLLQHLLPVMLTDFKLSMQPRFSVFLLRHFSMILAFFYDGRFTDYNWLRCFDCFLSDDWLMIFLS